MKASKRVDSRLPAAVLWTVRVLFLVALTGSLYLAWTSFSSGAVAGCGPDSGCDRVLQSRWARWLGIPVSAPAATVYLLLLGATWLLAPSVREPMRKRAWLLAIAGAVVVGGAAFWFIALQAFVVGAFCPFCSAVHASGLVGAGLLWWYAPVRRKGVARSRARTGTLEIPARRALRYELLGVFVLLLLVGGQAVMQPARYRVSTLDIHEGRLQFDLREVPLMGSPQAEHFLVSLFDYTCHHCRDLHPLLEEVQTELAGKLAIVSIVLPLSADCNRLLKRTPSAHVQACEYARLSLAVWRADREVYPAFDEWLMEGDQPPPVEVARERAQEWVGAEKLAAALEDPWIGSQLDQHVSVYEANVRQAGTGQMPQLVIGSSVVAGPPDSKEQLYELLKENLGLDRAAR